MIWSSANNSVDSCWFFESLIPVMSCFCHLVISCKYMLNSVGESGQPWRTPIFLPIVSLLLNFINILFFVQISAIAFNNVSGICRDLKMLNKICLCYQILSHNLQTASVFPS
jgi:hypothetical protein